MKNFNVNTSELNMKKFCDSYRFKSLIKVPTFFKNPENPSCIDLILTNNTLSFQNSGVIETGLSDFHKMIVTVMKTTYQKLDPKITHYRDYNTFCNDNFREHLLSALVMENLDTNNGLEKFLVVCVKTLDRFAPYKKKYLRGNNMPFMNKSLSRAFMRRSQLRSKYLKKRSETNRLAYAKQRNFCVSLLRKTKKDYYANLNEKDIADNKKFWQTVKPLFSDKVKSKEKITLVQGEMISTEDEKNAELLNAFFSSAVSNLNIPEYSGINILAERISHPTLKAILKYKNYPVLLSSII